MIGNQHICDMHFQPGFTDWGSFAQYVHQEMLNMDAYSNSGMVIIDQF
jgi:D-arabinose 1-dehydrogenase-like Zn-dependent alcohol dehydrogenase